MKQAREQLNQIIDSGVNNRSRLVVIKKNYLDINLLEFLNSGGSWLKSTSTDLKPPVLKLLLGLACSLALWRSRTLLLLPLGLMDRGRSSLIIPVFGLTTPVSVFKQYLTSSVFYYECLTNFLNIILNFITLIVLGLRKTH